MLVFPLLSAVLSLCSLIFIFVCLFAGSKTDYLENYHVLTLNTSRIGANFLKANISGAQTSTLHDVTSYLNPSISSGNKDTESLATLLGINDFYSAHMMTFCEGSYRPTPIVNATLPRRKIQKDVSYCSPSGSWYGFDATQVLTQALWESNTGITLDDLEWSDEIAKKTSLMATSFKASFFFYCLGLAWCFARLLVICVRFSFRLMDRVPIFLLEMVFSNLAWFFLLIPSIVLTATAMNSAQIINKYGKPIGVGAYAGDGFFALSWVATFMMMFTAGLSFFGQKMEKKQAAKKAEEDYERRISRRMTRRQTKNLESVWTDPIIRQKQRNTLNVSEKSGTYAEPGVIQSW